MGYATLQPPQKPRRIKSLCSEKSASGDFFTKAVISSLGNPSDPLKRQLENHHTSTKTASGVRIKNYLDHVYAVSDKDGDIKEHYRYTAFGEAEIYNTFGQKLAESAIDNDVLWNSRRFDGDTGLYYYKYRHYAAKLGRWLGRDPLGDEAFLMAYIENILMTSSVTDELKSLIGRVKTNSLKNLYHFISNDSLNSFDYFGLHCCDCPINDRGLFAKFEAEYGVNSGKFCDINRLGDIVTSKLISSCQSDKAAHSQSCKSKYCSGTIKAKCVYDPNEPTYKYHWVILRGGRVIDKECKKPKQSGGGGIA